LSKILIFGNSASGKSTLAKELAAENDAAHLDLDTLAWLPATPPQRAPLAESAARIDAFTAANGRWVIEGCYTGLLELLSDRASEIVYLDLPLEQCLQNAQRRPWEPHKYKSQAEQDANLPMLLDWIRQYETRDDEFSRAAHARFYAQFDGPKRTIATNDRPPAT